MVRLYLDALCNIFNVNFILLGRGWYTAAGVSNFQFAWILLCSMAFLSSNLNSESDFKLHCQHQNQAFKSNHFSFSPLAEYTPFLEIGLHYYVQQKKCFQFFFFVLIIIFILVQYYIKIGYELVTEKLCHCQNNCSKFFFLFKKEDKKQQQQNLYSESIQIERKHTHTQYSFMYNFNKHR